ncbi:MAG TPA: aldolase/citrate lyase family protein [Afifellaceae bacterium]|nr:aldolase/citrate lyase family protein [Afifellaceae bacterium]
MLVQIETHAALDRVEEIAGVDGVDRVFFGPADLSADMGLLGQPNHDDVAATIKGGADLVRAVGKATGILVGDAALATMSLGAGITFVACGSDLNLLARGARTLAHTVGEQSGLKA